MCSMTFTRPTGLETMSDMNQMPSHGHIQQQSSGNQSTVTQSASPPIDPPQVCSPDQDFWRAAADARRRSRRQDGGLNLQEETDPIQTVGASTVCGGVQTGSNQTGWENWRSSSLMPDLVGSHHGYQFQGQAFPSAPQLPIPPPPRTNAGQGWSMQFHRNPGTQNTQPAMYHALLSSPSVMPGLTQMFHNAMNSTYQTLTSAFPASEIQQGHPCYAEQMNSWQQQPNQQAATPATYRPESTWESWHPGAANTDQNAGPPTYPESRPLHQVQNQPCMTSNQEQNSAHYYSIGTMQDMNSQQ